jgi:hypothetical protein
VTSRPEETGVVLRQLIDALGEAVLTDPKSLAAARTDRSGKTSDFDPICVVEAKSTDDVVAVMKIANQTLTPVVTRGAGSGLAGGAIGSLGEIVLSLAKMNKIIMSSFHAIFSIGLMAGAFLGGILENEEFTTEEHFSLIALMNILIIPFSFPNLLMDKPVQDESKPTSSIFNLGPYLITLSFIAFCGMLCEGAMADWISLYFKEYSPNSPFPITIGFSFFAAAMVVGRFFGDTLSMK